MIAFKNSNSYNKLAHLRKETNKHRKIFSFILIAVFLSFGVLLSSISSDASTSRNAPLTGSSEGGTSILLNELGNALGAGNLPDILDNSTIWYIDNDGDLTISDTTVGHNYIVMQQDTSNQTSNKIVIGENCHAKITLRNVNMRCSNYSLIKIGENSNVELSVENGSVNTITKTDASNNYAAINVKAGSTLTITGGGTLNVETNNNAAAIGANANESCGNINIDMAGGTLNATAMGGSAIGGAICSDNGRSVGDINIKCGTINATSNGKSATIGSGCCGGTDNCAISSISISKSRNDYKTDIIAENLNTQADAGPAIGIGGSQSTKCKINIDEYVDSLLAISHRSSGNYNTGRTISNPTSDSDTTAGIIQQRFQSTQQQILINEESTFAAYGILGSLKGTDPVAFNANDNNCIKFTLPQGTTEYACKVWMETSVVGESEIYNIVKIDSDGNPEKVIFNQQAYNESPTEFLGANKDWEYKLVTLKDPECAIHAKIPSTGLNYTYTGNPYLNDAVSTNPNLKLYNLGTALDKDNYKFLFVNKAGEEINALNAGDYLLKISLSTNNYAYCYTTFTINKATLTVAPNNATTQYGDPAPTFTSSFTGFMDNDDEDNTDISGSIDYDTDYQQGDPAGNYTISVKDVSALSSKNYEFQASDSPATLTVNKATIKPDNITVKADVDFGKTLKQANVTATAKGVNGFNDTIVGTFVFDNDADILPGIDCDNGYAGPYRGTFTPVDTDNYTTCTTDVSVTVNSVTPSITSLIATDITYGQSLANSTLSATITNPNNSALSVPGKLTWYVEDVNSTFPSYNNHSFSYKFTPKDLSKYNIKTGTVNVPFNKADPTVTVTTSPSIYYGQTLADTVFEYTATNPYTGDKVAGALAFDSGITQPGASRTYSATFTPVDTDNYKTYTTNVSVTVNPATPQITEITASDIYGGDKLENSELTATIKNPYDHDLSDVEGKLEWKDKDTVPQKREHKYEFIFTPTGNNADKYESVKLEATVKVIEKDKEQTVDAINKIEKLKELTINDNPSKEDINSIVKATIAYESLSKVDKNFIEKLYPDDYATLTNAQEKAKLANHKTDEVKVINDKLPWYVSLEVSPATASDSAKGLLTSTQTILQTRDIYLKNLLTGKKYSDDIGDITVQWENPDLTGYNSVFIIHELTDGSAEPITPDSVTEDMTEFRTKSFSVFSLVGDTEFSSDSSANLNNDNSDSAGNNSGSSATNSFSSTSDNSTVPTIILICVLVLSGTIVVALVCLKNKKSYKH